MSAPAKKRNLLLLNSLAPLEKYLTRKRLVELMINQPGEVVLETKDGIETIRDPALSLHYLENLAHLLAADAGQMFGDLHPILACALPAPYRYRVQIVGKSVVAGGFAMAIRVGAASVFPLENWFDPENAEALKAALFSRKNILICGGTSTGKTTFLNSLLTHIPDSERIITIEDAAELALRQPNIVQLLKSKTGTDAAKVGYTDLINSTLRMRPDRIILGELDIENTLPFLRAINTGHGGSMATLHADSPEKAIEALIINLSLAGKGGNEVMMRRYITNALDYIVHLKRESRTKYSAALQKVESL